MRPTRTAFNAGGMFPALCVSLLAAAPASVAAQATPAKPTPLEASMDKLAKHPTVAAAFSALQSDNAWTLDQQASICQIPAPPFKEQARAAEYAKRFRELGVQNVRIDKEGNVIGEIRGAKPGPTLMLAGHLDTVFPEGTDVHVKREGTKLIAPGIGDDCRGLAVVLSVARQVITQKIPFSGKLLVVGNVGEEGPGNLRGMRAIFGGPMRDSVDMFISVDGTGFGVTNGGVGSNRYRVHYKGPGGHSWGAFGQVNPAFAMGNAIARLGKVVVPKRPKVSYNIGVLSGGTSVNSIPYEVAMEVDMRSASPEELRKIDAEFKRIVAEAVDEENATRQTTFGRITYELKLIGERPSGTTSPESPLARQVAATMRVYDKVPVWETSSTDANIPISLGIPAIAVARNSATKGGRAHSLDEWTDVEKTQAVRDFELAAAIILGVASMP